MSQATKKCPHCEKLRKLHDKDVQEAFRLGKHDGENQLRHTINIMKASHRRLYNELTRLDRYNPLPDADDVIKVPKHYLEKVIVELRSKSSHFTVARTLKKMIKEQNGNGSIS